MAMINYSHSACNNDSKVDLVLRKSGISAGKVDVIYSQGKKIEKPAASYDTNTSTYDFQSGKIIQQLPPPSISLYRCSAAPTSADGNSAAAATNSLKRKLAKSGGVGTGMGGTGGGASAIVTISSSSAAAAIAAANLRQQLEFSRALRTDVSLVPPIRQTASIFKQPVTVVRNHENNKVKHDPKHGGQEKPKQLFWEKRLERLRSCHATGEEFDDIVLPNGMRATGPNVDEQTVLQSLATALHVLNTPVTGQTSTKTEMIKNATAFINPDQPLMQAVLVSEDDIRRQEDRVNVARRKLQEALIKAA